jgi:hypothetical protein
LSAVRPERVDDADTPAGDMSGVILAPETTTGVASQQNTSPRRIDDASTLARDLSGISLARAGNEPSRARLGSARCLNELGSVRPFHELAKEAQLGSTLAREPARLGSRAIFWYFLLHYLVN